MAFSDNEQEAEEGMATLGAMIGGGALAALESDVATRLSRAPSGLHPEVAASPRAPGPHRQTDASAPAHGGRTGSDVHVARVSAGSGP